MLNRIALTLVTLIGSFVMAVSAVSAQDVAAPEEGYVDVGDLHMYYQIYGEATDAPPVILLHGAYMNADLMAGLGTELGATRQIVAVDLQGHGRTNDIDRPITYEDMADDVYALTQELGFESVDVVGYSMGGGTALQVAVRHPEMVNRLVAISASFRLDGMYPDMLAMIETMTPEMFAGSPIIPEYERLSPNPDGFATLMEKLVELDGREFDWSEQLAALETPTLLIMGDSDVIQLQHIIDMFGLFGGGVNGDLAGLPNSQLAIIPGASHTGVIGRVNLLTPMITDFLDGVVHSGF